MNAIAKRLFDIVFSLFVLLCSAPLSLLVAFAIKLDDGGPVFYRQQRIGLGGKPFAMWKFRSMVQNAEKAGGLTRQGDRRITRVGEYIRRYKLDELPQFLNVLVGEMTVVGPRPEVAVYVDQYSSEQRQVLQHKPGITDPASIAYRNEAELLAASAEGEKLYIDQIMPDKIRINLDYQARADFWSDLAVVWATAWTAVRP